MKRVTPMALALLIAGCGTSTTEPEPDCVPPGPEAEWCHHLDNDAVRDSLLAYPDSLDPSTGLPWDTMH